MGYYVGQSLYEVRIKKENEPKFWEIMRQLEAAPDKPNKDHYSWVTPGFSKLETLEECLNEWGYTHVSGEDYFEIEPVEWESKLGDEEIFWKALAPIIEDNGAWIECTGSDGELWGWFFENGKLVTKLGEVVYKEPKEPGGEDGE